MKSTTAAIRNDPDAPRVDLLKKLPYRKGQLKRSDIKKAVKAVVRIEKIFRLIEACRFGSSGLMQNANTPKQRLRRRPRLNEASNQAAGAGMETSHLIFIGLPRLALTTLG
jgi:hypothetical protein